jgi:transglutaminase-like putative cysteine protease
MSFSISTHFAFEAEDPADVLLQYKAARIPEQQIAEPRCDLDGATLHVAVAAQDDIGERSWVRVEGRCDVHYEARATIERVVPRTAELAGLPAHELPGTTVQYLLDSRYCPAGRFQSFVETQFAGTAGGARIEAIREWIARELSYTPGVSGPDTTALDSFVERRGICRDYAHLVVSFARASAIPARFVSCYAPNVDPPDFHAVAEVFLADPTGDEGGMWHLVDATGMASGSDIVKIGIGRDAADVSFMTSFGPCSFLEKTIRVVAEETQA